MLATRYSSLLMLLFLCIQTWCFASPIWPIAEAEQTPPELPPMPIEVTSFGACRHAETIYVYGGHMGSAHSYSKVGQNNKLLKLDLNHPEKGWQEIASGQPLQGLGMVAYGGRIILVGGFTALNDEGEEQNLHSQSSVTAFDPETNQWSELPPLPEARSSHDAALVGDTLYVVGGWNMSGPKQTTWHTTAWSMDLSAESPQWKALPQPPFIRRALATIAHDDKLFVIGGMNEKGGPTRDVVVYDPKQQTWTEVAEIKGESGMAGFGASGWSLNGRLIVNTYEGSIQAWNPDTKDWVVLGESEDARFFHRILPLNQDSLISLGGASMEQGKFSDLELITPR